MVEETYELDFHFPNNKAIFCHYFNNESHVQYYTYYMIRS